jgi:proteasome lid subunit RPN8/RPN11
MTAKGVTHKRKLSSDPVYGFEKARANNLVSLLLSVMMRPALHSMRVVERGVEDAVIDWRAWWSATIEAAKRLLAAIRPPLEPSSKSLVLPARPLAPLARVRLTDEVCRVLFAEYAAHLSGDRGDEETGWALLGYREGDTALVTATLPAGTERQAGQGHVHFNRTAQALASRIVRQEDKRLTLLGIVHTHPGSLRHPSDGDYRGDVRWVANLRGGEGVFGIGTDDGPEDPTPGVAWSPQPHRQCQDGLSWCWYALGANDRNYRPLPVELTIGPDLAMSLRPVWDVLESHAARLERLARQLSRVSFEVVDECSLAINVPLPNHGSAIRVVMAGKTVQYFVLRNGQAMVADLPEPRVDQGVFLLLSELAAQNVDEPID